MIMAALFSKPKTPPAPAAPEPVPEVTDPNVEAARRAEVRDTSLRRIRASTTFGGSSGGGVLGGGATIRQGQKVLLGQ